MILYIVGFGVKYEALCGRRTLRTISTLRLSAFKGHDIPFPLLDF